MDKEKIEMTFKEVWDLLIKKNLCIFEIMNVLKLVEQGVNNVRIGKSIPEIISPDSPSKKEDKTR